MVPVVATLLLLLLPVVLDDSSSRLRAVVRNLGLMPLLLVCGPYLSLLFYFSSFFFFVLERCAL
jgi:hypothetical protein